MSRRQPSSLRQHGSRRSGGGPAVVRLGLLGGFELEARNRLVQVPLQVQRLLVFLALQDRALRRAYVAGRLWSEATQEHAFGSLRTTLWRTHCISAPVVETTSTHLALASAVAVDARELAGCAERALHGHAARSAETLEQLAEADELLPDWHDDWVIRERDHLGQLRLLALEATCEELGAAGFHNDAAAAALAAVAADPLRESARRLLISAFLNAGNRAEAAHQFLDFRRRLKRELGLEPSLRMRELEREFARRSVDQAGH